MATYTVFDEGQTRTGEACGLLEEIRSRYAADNEELRRMDVDQYAQALIEDAPYFLPESLLKALTAQPYESEYDRALAYLAAMPTSGIHILSRN